tara:strand:- start:1546 stop:3498 length:1953 start_codon:yes stop_codon:yes gene_type:complete
MSTLSESIAAAATPTRRNKSATIERTDKYVHIDQGLVPFKYGSVKNKSAISVRDAVILCQKAYYNFSIFRNTIDVMTEFTCTDLYYEGGSKKSRSFFEALFKKINVYELMDKFFREYYRSGNVFVYRFDAKLKASDLKRINQTFGAKGGKKEIPFRYIILNPADVQVSGTLSFNEGKYFKILSDFELERLKNPKTDEDFRVIEGLDPETKKQLKNNPSMQELRMTLHHDKVSTIFYKKMDYEPFAVPMGYPVLEDLNHKAELKKMDMAIARTVQQAILLVTMGAEPDKGGVNQKNLQEMQKLFENQSVGRVLIADYTTKAQFVIPQISDILDPKKYEQVNKDINAGLNNILTGVGGSGEKFANHQAKVEVFIARLRQARKTFLNDFLIPEIKRVAKEIGFKNYPTPKFTEINLRDNTQKYRVYTRMAELGLLTPEELFEALDTNRLPDKEASMDSQRKYISDRDDGLYFPLVGGQPIDNPSMESWEPQEVVHPELQKKEAPAPKKNTDKKPKDSSTTKPNTGRPPGTNSPQTTKEASPVGASERSFSFDLVKENMLKAQKLETEVASHLRKKHKVKRLTKKQKEVAEQISNVIIANEKPEAWVGAVNEYCEKPIDKNHDQVEEIRAVAYEHQLGDYLAGILYHSVIKEKE